MGYKLVKYIPYKISCVSFVPLEEYNVEHLQIALGTRMEDPAHSAKLFLFSVNAEQIVKQHEADVKSIVTDMGWLNNDAVITGSKNGETTLYQLKDDLSPVFSWSSEKTGITSVSVFSHAGPNDPAFVRTTENGNVSILSKTSPAELRSYKDECSVRCSLGKNWVRNHWLALFELTNHNTRVYNMIQGVWLLRAFFSKILVHKDNYLRPPFLPALFILYVSQKHLLTTKILFRICWIPQQWS